MPARRSISGLGPLAVLFGLLLHAAQALAGAAPPGAVSAGPVDLVRVYKAERRMELLSKDVVLRRYAIALGANPVGHKSREGDERTPEGLYVLNWRNPNSASYKSIHISYPNKADKEAARKAGVSPGGMIMVHGQPNGFGWAAWVTQWFDWTDGCIAVTNAEMDEIWEMVGNGTPIEIAP